MQEVLRTLEGRLGPRHGEPEPLPGGMTNRNYRVRFGAVDHVVRMCGAESGLLGIDREAERAAAEIAHTAGVGPEVTAFLADEHCLVTAYVEGRPLEAADVRREAARVARALRAVHGAGTVPATFSAFRTCERYLEIARSRGAALPAAIEPAVAAARVIEAALPPFAAALCHNDLLPANMMFDEAGELWLIDWELTGMGDPFFDLGNVAAMSSFAPADEVMLLDAYLGRGTEGDLARLRLQRAAVHYREGMWGVAQQAISDLDVDFAAYAEEHLGLMLASNWEEWLDGAAA